MYQRINLPREGRNTLGQILEQIKHEQSFRVNSMVFRAATEGSSLYKKFHFFERDDEIRVSFLQSSLVFQVLILPDFEPFFISRESNWGKPS